MTDIDPRLEISTRIFDGDGHQAGLVNLQADEPSWPAMAAEAIRAINHLTSRSTPIPAPVLYTILGELERVGARLPQTCQQLSEGLQLSLEQHAPHEDDGGDPRERVILARSHLARAAEAAETLGEALGAAQAAIAHQALRDPDERAA